MIVKKHKTLQRTDSRCFLINAFMAVLKLDE